MNDAVRVETLSDVPADLQSRVELTAQLFQQRFGATPQFVVVTPGRVNLIGEHTDYNGFPVLPAAIDRSIAVAVQGRRDFTVHAISTAYPRPCTFSIEGPIHPGAPGDWGNYVKAAALVVQELCDHPRGADLLVDSTIPSSAGLSSSSALVVASGLAFLTANGVVSHRLDLAERFAAAEHFVGTLSGGMDQAIALLARAGYVLRIDFFPLRTEAIPFPSDYAIAVCHSLVRAEKSGRAKTAYNLRVWECTVGCRALAYLLPHAPEPRPLPLQRLADATRYSHSWSPERFVDVVHRSLPDRPVTVAEVADALRVPLAEFLRDLDRPPVGLDQPLAVVRRLRHVFTEAQRVQQAVEALKNGDLETLGRTMTESHASCRDNYEISCPELEELVAAARVAGALGARLTGAGFGGATVQIVPRAALTEFFRIMDTRFYEPCTGRDSDLSRYRFAFAPAGGTRVIAS